MRARTMMEQAIQTKGGSGAGNTPAWRPSQFWSDGSSLADWSPTSWPDIATAPHLATYRSAIERPGFPERESTATGGLVQVQPHIRDGHSVSGHTRSSPAR